MKTLPVFLFCVCLLPARLPAADANDADIDEEDAAEFQNYRVPPGSEWKEQGLVLPPYPGDDELIGIDIGRHDYPYKVFIDRASLSFGKDRIVRYTVVLRSRAGVDNVSFEGIKCSRRQYKRYAYGANGHFNPVPAKDWQFIRRKRQDIYRAVLAEEYFCPLPIGDVLAEIKKKLQAGNVGDIYTFSGDEE